MTTTLTNDQITAGAAVLCDHGQPSAQVKP